MRISSGKWRGRSILAPEGKLKPTSDKVRQSIFSILRSDILGSRFLDLYAGSGSVGITALSEGASFVTFIERDSQTYKSLRENLRSLAQKEEYQGFRSDVNKISNLLKGELFDIVFADPFYPDINSFVKTLHRNTMELLAPEGIFILEHGRTTKAQELSLLEGYQETKSYGDTALSIFRKKRAQDES